MTDPWVEDSNGHIIDPAPYLEHLGIGDCEECLGGFFGPLEDYQLQRCDLCATYSSDIEAAQALARLIGNGATVRY